MKVRLAALALTLILTAAAATGPITAQVTGPAGAVGAERKPGERPGTWAFDPGIDRFSDKALLDLSALNEDTAGATGFVRRSPDGAGFVRGDGTPIRFWAVNTGVKGIDTLGGHARFLAKRGVNMVRLHGQLPQGGRKGGGIEAIEAGTREHLWRLVATMKEEGIYVTFSPYYPHLVRAEAQARWGVPTDGTSMTGLLYFDPVVQEAYKGWLRQTLIPPNPHTGIALKDDPALAIIQMQNEDSLLFWTFNNLKGRELRLLGARFGEFLAEKYGSLDAARAAWDNETAPGPVDGMDDDWESGVIALSGIWHLTGAHRGKNAISRRADQAEFLTRLMHDWHAEIARFLREEIGAPQLFNAGNWRTADDVLLDDLERYAYTAGDVIGVNRYVNALHKGQQQGWAIIAQDRFREEGVLHRPLDLPLTLRQPMGFPYIIPETLWVPPMWQQSEGPILMAAYQALTGIDISFWFISHRPQWRAPESANGYLPSVGKWVASSPQQMGAFPAAALIFRQGLVDEAPPVIVEHRELDELWSRRPPIAAAGQGYDPNRDGLLEWAGSLIGRDTPDAARASPYSFLVGPVQVAFGSAAPDVIHPDLDRLIDEERGRVESLNGQLVWDWRDAVVTIDAPRAQGVVGRLSERGRIELGDLTIESDAAYASIVVAPLDGLPIARSTRLLVQIGSMVRPTGWEAFAVEHEGEPALEVASFGEAPWQVDRVSATLSLRNPGISRATVLDGNGMPVGDVPLARQGGTINLTLPDNALYLLLH
ncbi:MAG: hypothetical protein AAF577_13465 [Pseudomonadota bacterium]